MKISLKEVDYVANLGRLSLDEHSKKLYQTQLNFILEYMDKLGEVNTDHVEPMAGPVELFTPLREDNVINSLTQDEALANAPDRFGETFRAPKIIE